MVKREVEFPTDYRGVVRDVEFLPKGTKNSKYNNPTTELTIDAYEPEYKNPQKIFVQHEKEEHFSTDTADKNAINSETYTGAFFTMLLKAGVKINLGDTAYQVLQGLKGKYVRAKKLPPAPDRAPKAKGEKWYIIEVSEMKPQA